MSTEFQPLEKTGVTRTLLILAAAALAFSSFAWWEQDDFYIHLQYVRHLVTRGEWSFTAGTPSYGTTSPLWILAVSVPAALGVPPPLAAKLLSVGFAVGCAFLLLRARDLIRNGAVRAAALVALLADHWLRLAAGSGMEATLASFLTLVLGLALIRGGEASPRCMAYYGALCGLLILARPEFFVLPAILLFAPRSRQPARWLAGAAALLLAVAVVVGPWLAYAIATFGTIEPNTIALKIASGKPPLIPSLGNVIGALRRQASFFGPMYLPGLVAIAAALWLALRGRMPGLRRVPLAAWGLLLFLPAMYFVIQVRGGEAITYRYGAPVLPLLVLLGFMHADALAAGRDDRLVRRLAAAASLWVVAAGFALSCAHLPSLRRSHDYLQDVLVRYGVWLNANTPPTAVVGCYDVGAIAYYSRRPILDLVGLNSPEVIPFHRPDELPHVNAAAIAKFRPDYLVTFAHADTGDMYAGLPVAETLLSGRVEPYRFGGPGAGGPSHTCFVWRLDWSKADSK